MSDTTEEAPGATSAAGEEPLLPALGTTLAKKYRLESILGEGGFGRVYRAVDIGTNRPVAVKMLKRSDTSVNARFLREARAIAKLTNPSTLTLFDYGEVDGALFMVTEFVPGEDLADRLARELLNEAQLVHVLIQILGSLEEAHANGLLHRDLKPANIRLFEYAADPLRVKVLDFGLAKTFDAPDVPVTRSGVAVGTPRYMSPEQLTGEPMGPASDLFSLGLVALECIYSRSHSALTDIRQRLLGIRVTPDARLSSGMSMVLQHMLNREPEDRYQTAGDVLSDLKQLRNAATEPMLDALTSEPSSAGTATSASASTADENAPTEPLLDALSEPGAPPTSAASASGMESDGPGAEEPEGVAIGALAVPPWRGGAEPVSGGSAQKSEASLPESVKGVLRVTIPLGGTIQIGRADNVDLLVTDPSISRYHASIAHRSSGEFIVRDLGSAHGTRVNGRPVTEARLTSRDRLGLGAAEFRVRIEKNTVYLRERSTGSPQALRPHAPHELTEPNSELSPYSLLAILLAAGGGLCVMSSLLI